MLYDLAVLESVSSGDQSFVNNILQIFVDTMPKSISDLRQSLQQKDWEMVGKHAHKMKSTIDCMGIASLKNEIRAVEALGKTKTNLDKLPVLVEHVSATITRCIAEIKSDHCL